MGEPFDPENAELSVMDYLGDEPVEPVGPVEPVAFRIRDPIESFSKSRNC